jgi:hypothetical protein
MSHAPSPNRLRHGVATLSLRGGKHEPLTGISRWPMPVSVLPAFPLLLFVDDLVVGLDHIILLRRA